VGDLVLLLEGKVFKGVVYGYFMIWKAYEQFDKGIMKCVNSGMRAWNWTTGRTKVDLANSMLFVAPMIESTGVALYSTSLLPVIAPLFFGASLIYMHLNKNVEKAEEKASENRAMSTIVLDREKISKFCTPVLFSISGSESFLGYVGEGSANNGYWLSLGFGMRGFSEYVMRADSLPPRKNVLSRAKDGLIDMLENYRAEPVVDSLVL